MANTLIARKPPALRDPIAATHTINRRIHGADFDARFKPGKMHTDQPIIATYGVMRSNQGDLGFGNALTTDSFGCPLMCSHCWVSLPALAGAVTAPIITKRLPSKRDGDKKFLPDDRFVYTADEFFAMNLKKISNAGTRSYDGMSLTGGEPTIYRGGIKRLGQLAQEKGLFFSIDTMGLLIANDAKYLKAWDGLQDTLRFYVSIKHVEVDEYERFTKVPRKHMDDAFVAMRRLLQAGFVTEPGGIVLNVWYNESDAKREKQLGLAPETLLRQRLEKLHDRLSDIHPDFPRLLGYHKITYGYVHDMHEQKLRMQQPGYGQGYPSKALAMINQIWSERGTPIIAGYDGDEMRRLSPEYARTMNKIIADLSGKPAARTVYAHGKQKAKVKTAKIA